MRIGLVGAGRIGAFHARTLRDLEEIETVVLTDADADRARTVAQGLGIEAVDDVEALVSSGVDGVTIAAATPAHAKLIHRVISAGLPVFCEKPVAPDVAGTREIIAHARATGVPLQVGFQRRFDAGYQAAREAVRGGRLGWLHTLRAVTADQMPPPADYITTSGGIFRDCGVHDYDAVRWVTGRQIVEVSALGTNRGDAFFSEAGDVDTGVAMLKLDDDTLAVCSAARYNGAGYDVRLEVAGSAGTAGVGLDDGVPLASMEDGVDWPEARAHETFLERFHAAYVSELATFTEVAAGRAENPCDGEEALEALLVAEAAELSRKDRRAVRVEEVHG